MSEEKRGENSRKNTIIQRHSDFVGLLRGPSNDHSTEVLPRHFDDREVLLHDGNRRHLK